MSVPYNTVQQVSFISKILEKTDQEHLFLKKKEKKITLKNCDDDEFRFHSDFESSRSNLTGKTYLLPHLLETELWIT